MRRLKHQQLSLPTVEIFLKIEEQILINAARKLRTNKRLIDDDIQSWQLDKLNQLGALNEENYMTLAKHSGLALDEVSKMLEQAGYSAVSEIETDMLEAVRRGILSSPGDIKSSESLLNILQGYENHSRDWINMVNTTMLDQSRQQYLNVVQNVTGKVMSGVSTPEQALREAARSWGQMGVPAMIDKAGREWSTEAYVNMITRTVTTNVTHEMQYARMDEYGVDLIEVSSHAGARPLCAPYQGRIFSRSGTNRNYPAFSETSHGEPAGLFGINCGHFKYPYIPGITERTYFPHEDGVENALIYEQSQSQRHHEREIRKAKREYNMMKEMKDEKGMEEAKQKVLKKQANMRTFIDNTGRTRQRDRETLPVGNPHVRGRLGK